MIATVKIAPLEHWCDGVKHLFFSDPITVDAVLKSVGMPIKILTESCDQSDWCEGKCWQQVDTDEFRISLGLGPRVHDLGQRVACEHMLEMD